MLGKFRREARRGKQQPQVHRQVVHLDRYGNAIPAVIQQEEGKLQHVFRVVEQREIIVYKDVINADAHVVEQGFLRRFLPRKEKPAVKLSAEQTSPGIVAQAIRENDPAAERNLHAKLAMGFQRMSEEFDRREQRMEQRLRELQQRPQSLPGAVKSRSRLRFWTMASLGVMAKIALIYMLFVLTFMQDSMRVMSDHVAGMNQYMGDMSADTRMMSGNMQSMNQSMHHLNSNMTHMNQQMSTISQAAGPMADTAGMMRPFTGMMRKFMPF